MSFPTKVYTPFTCILIHSGCWCREEAEEAHPEQAVFTGVSYAGNPSQHPSIPNDPRETWDLVTNDILYLAEHQKLSGQKSYICVEYRKLLSLSSDLHQNQKQYTGEKHFRRENRALFVNSYKPPVSGRLFQCEDAAEDFLTSTGLLQHQSSLSAAYSLRSRETFHGRIKKVFSEGVQDIGHQGIQFGGVIHEGSVCGKFLNSRYSLKHQRTHDGRKPYVCSVCEKSLLHNHTLVGHQQRIHTGERTSMCMECGKSLSSKYSLVEHQRIHNGEKPYLCNACGKSFRHKQTFVGHRLRIHTGERPYICAACGKSFIQASDHIRHQRIHSGKRAYECIECGKSFLYKQSLLDHQRLHAGERPFECSACGKAVIHKKRLFEHQRIHSGEKPYVCIKCGKSFIWSSDYIWHQRIHTGERAYECSECGKAFTCKQTLLKHHQSHTRQKPYQCSECGKGFNLEYELLQHQRVHTKEQTYECTECGKTSHKKRVEHQRVHAGEKSCECSECGKRCRDHTSA